MANSLVSSPWNGISSERKSSPRVEPLLLLLRYPSPPPPPPRRTPPPQALNLRIQIRGEQRGDDQTSARRGRSFSRLSQQSQPRRICDTAQVDVASTPLHSAASSQGVVPGRRADVPSQIPILPPANVGARQTHALEATGRVRK